MRYIPLALLSICVARAFSSPLLHVHHSRSQSPLLSEPHPNPLPLSSDPSPSHPSSETVSLVFTSNTDETTTVELPLRHRVNPGDMPGVPLHPHAVHISSNPRPSAAGNKEQAVETTKLARIICLVHPVISPEERSIKSHHGRPRALGDSAWALWFMAKDGVVLFDVAASRHFLAGRAVESYECF